MNDIVYKTKEEALDACKKASNEIWEVMDKYGAWETSDDDCVTTYISAHYLDEYGKQRRCSFSD